MLVPICAYVVMAVSLNLTVGILGELSLGHAGFHERGRFCRHAGVWSACADTHLRQALQRCCWPLWWAALWRASSASWSASLSCALSGDYLAIVTLAFGEIVKNYHERLLSGHGFQRPALLAEGHASLNLDADGKVLINGAMGITGIKKASTFTVGIRAGYHHAACHSEPGQLPRRAAPSWPSGITEIAARSVGIPITQV